MQKPEETAVVQNLTTDAAPRARRRWTGWDSVDLMRKPSKRACSEGVGENGDYISVLAEQSANVPTFAAADALITNTSSRPQDNGESSAHVDEAPSPLPDEPTRLRYWLPPDYVPAVYWTHEPYRNAAGESVQVCYSYDLATSENLAQRFLQCSVVGFDMEWHPRSARGIKGNISLIQVACEDVIALFHIALHDGRKRQQLLAPSLKKLIEDERILKCGVAINSADGNRLRRFMNLEPKGMFELSFLHSVVWWGKRDPKKVSKRLVKMTRLVEWHLGRPLFKGSVRTSDWTKPLSCEQIRYAAADAYAGFRLFHALDARRLKMDPPIPPRPRPAELGLPLLLGTEIEESDNTTKPHENLQAPSNESQEGANPRPTKDDSRSEFKSPPISSLTLEDPQTRRTFSALSALRKRLSLKMKQSEESLVAEWTLFKLAERCPQDAEALESVASWRKWGNLVRKEANVDLVAFLRRHAPQSEEKDPAAAATATNDLGEFLVDGAFNEAEKEEDASHNDEGSTVRGFAREVEDDGRKKSEQFDAEDLEKYFSDDYVSSDTENDADDDDLHEDKSIDRDEDREELDEEWEEVPAFEKLETSFSATYDKAPTFRSSSSRARSRRF